MKKLLYCMLIFVVIISNGRFSAMPMVSAAGETIYSDDRETVSLENSMIRFQWQKSNGTLKGLLNKVTQTKYLGGIVSANWTAFIDTGTGNPWKAWLGTMYKGKDAVLSKVRKEQLDNGVRVSLEFNRVGGKNISIIQHITMYDRDPVSRWTTEIINNEPNSTVTAVVTPQVTGIQTLQGEVIQWPFKEGELISNPGAELRMMQYPVPASMQWMELFNGSEGLYYAVLDKKAVFKEFRFGHDSGLDPAVGQKPRQMSVTFWPFTATGKTYLSPTVEIGVANEGKWYWGADRYRKWLTETAHWNKQKSKMASELDSWYPGFNKFYGKPLSQTYAQMVDYIKKVNVYGVQNLEMLGWHKDGFDSYYPDYEYLPDAGGAVGIEQALREIHHDGNRAFFYLNNHIADIESNWYKTTPEESILVKKLDGTPWEESYGNGRRFHVISPGADPWIKKASSLYLMA
ncbi:DUF6259 domain-containing protein, partial [Paenibacillus elgii]|uniref:DUF6259 domain-containing protein n=1 Tax=Paenibacillus elgii TaxID=189691 RepID=UPI000248D7C0